MMNYTISEYKSCRQGGVKRDVSYFGAFESGSDISFELSLPRRAGVVGVIMHIHADGMNEHPVEYPMKRSFNHGEYTEDKYTLDLTLSEESFPAGLYYYRYEINFGDAIVSYGGESVIDLTAFSDCIGDRQLLIYKKGFDTPHWIRGGIIYHVFVDRFKRSGRCSVKKGAVLNEDWDNGIPQYGEYPGADVSNNVFFGGDLYGITEKLDYIASLGVSCIYLSPVFDAASNHKYDTGDYLTVDGMFGGDEALENLTATANKLGISVILDGVFNHTGDDSIYFNKYGNYNSVGAYQSEDSDYFPWYDFQSYPDTYSSWWGVKILPRVHSGNDDFRKFICGDGGVAEKWSKIGIRGWRLDVADELDDSFLDDFRRAVKSRNRDAVIYGEVWEDASNKIAYGARRKYFRGNQLDAVMNYPLRSGIIDYIIHGDCKKIREATEGLYRRYPKQCSDMQMNIISTHDTVRILNELSGVGENGRTNEELSTARLSASEHKNAAKLVKLAYLIAATVPGVPSIYYGDEIGMEGYHDPFCRMPFPWRRKDDDLLGFFKKIGRLRRSESLYRDGLFKILRCDEIAFIFERYNDRRSVVTAINRIDDGFALSFGSKVTNALTGKKISSLKLPGKSYAVLSGAIPDFDSLRK